MSSSDVVIRVENLGKKYTLQHQQQQRHNTLRDAWADQARQLTRWVNPFTFAGQLRHLRRQVALDRERGLEDFWALKDVNFEIRRGERVGIIGRNGAGKSTLLKILSRITEPSTGRVEICGRVASLLEVGTGFHPELTGRENVYLNGAILGMTRREIRSKFDEIVAFAEVEKFLDTPVKRYSSGMYVRLAFAVAAHLEPEILVVDEVLAVGDASFQKKCLGKLEDVADQEGRTVLFVSHNMQAIESLCKKGVFLEGGQVKFLGEIGGAIGAYRNDSETLDVCRLRDWRSEGVAPGDSSLKLLYIGVSQLADNEFIWDDKPIAFDVLLECGSNSNSKDIGLQIHDLSGQVVVHTSNLAASGDHRQISAGFNLLSFELPVGALKPGKYHVRVWGVHPMVCFHFDVENALFIEVKTTNNELIRYGASAWKAHSGPGLCNVSVARINSTNFDE